MKLYLVRHGQTDWNMLDKKQGRTDIPLNETGIKQAERLRDEIGGMKFDVCISSPLRRAYKTAEIIVNGRCGIAVDERLIERSFGEFEGTLNDEWEKLTNKADTWDRKLNYAERGLEPAKEILARAKSFLEDVKQKYPDDYSILIVSHGAFLKALHFEIVGYDDNTNFHSFCFKNAELSEYEV